MTRWDPGDKRQILQQIADDERRPAHEQEAARRELAGPVAQSPPSSPRRRGRNANTPQTQEDLDSDVENWYQRDLRDSGLTCSDRHEIFHAFDPSTQSLLEEFSNRLVGLFSASDTEVLIDAYSKTKNEFVKDKVIETIRHIVTYSPIDKSQAQQFLDQIKRGLASPDLGDMLAMTFGVTVLPKPKLSMPREVLPWRWG
jgi:hypothetical protein